MVLPGWRVSKNQPPLRTGQECQKLHGPIPHQAVYSCGMNPPLVYVLVINWNGQEHLATCFDTLLQSSYPHARYVLVDNGSTDGSVAWFRGIYGADPRTEVLECGANLGWSGGNNVGLRAALEAGAEWILLLNNDTATPGDALEHLMACAEAHPGAGAIAPKMVMFNEPQILNSAGLECSLIGSCWDRGIGKLDGPRWDQQEPVLGVCGGAMLLRADALRMAGLLPEEFGIYLDDLDLCLRIREAGYEIVSCPKAVVRHKFSATLGTGAGARNKYFLNTRNRLWLLLRNWPVERMLQVLPLVLLGECKALGRAALDGEGWKFFAHCRAWAQAAGYIPDALAERRRRRRAGLKRGAFWNLLKRDRLFCAGLLLPVDGWYPPVNINGAFYHPMSRTAWVEVPAGRLRLQHAHCYPRLGPTLVRIKVEGRATAQLVTTGMDVMELELPACRLTLEAERIFTAEETGELVDLGGWFSFDPTPSNLK